MSDIMPTHKHEVAIREGKAMLAIFLYLALFFCSFTIYRRLVMNEIGLAYYHYGAALVKAIVLAKVILLGQLTRISRRLDDRPLIVPTLYKVVFFALFTLVFEIVEHAVAALIHGKPVSDAFQEIISVGRDELLARTLVIFVVFLPMVAFMEIGRTLGEGGLQRLFLKKRPPTSSDSPAAK